MFIEIVAPESWEEKQRGDEFARQSPTEGSLLPLIFLTIAGTWYFITTNR